MSTEYEKWQETAASGILVEAQVPAIVAPRAVGQWQLAWIRFRRHPSAVLGLAFLSIIVLTAILGPILHPFNPLFIPGARHPGGDPPSIQHLFGTDDAGRDVFTMVIDGARTSLAVGLLSTLIAALVGVSTGVVAGYAGGWVDNLLMRVVDMFFAVPLLFVVLVAARFLGQGKVASIIVIFGLLSWPLIARLVRASYLSLKTMDYVEAARATGVRDARIAFRHILPNALGPVLVVMTLLVGKNIVLEAFVSFLNFGIAADQVSWGNALANAQNAIGLGNWWWAFFPGAAIASTVLSMNFVGDALNDALNPRAAW
jgi:peptide/nickel transport system permease protein